MNDDSSTHLKNVNVLLLCGNETANNFALAKDQKRKYFKKEMI
jgi:hypothetical protein